MDEGVAFHHKIQNIIQITCLFNKGCIKTGSELAGGNSFRLLMPHRVLREKQAASHNITVLLPAYNEEVSIGSVVLLARRFAEIPVRFRRGSLGEGAGTGEIFNSCFKKLAV